MGALMHPWTIREESEEVVRFPSERVEVANNFDAFFEEEHERLFKALYFVTGNRHDAEELMQDAFLKLWERWDRIRQIEDRTAYLFRVVSRLLREVTPRQRAALLLVDLLGYPAEQAAPILRVRPSTVRALATQGRKALRATEGGQDA
jgi:DNA-directed RNA polymerase specialized sigma24 family protein